MLSVHRLQLVPGPRPRTSKAALSVPLRAALSWLPLKPLAAHLRVPGEEPEEEPKVKTQWPRSADEPGLYMAQTGNSGPPPFLCGGGPTVASGGMCAGVCLSVSMSWSSLMLPCEACG